MACEARTTQEPLRSVTCRHPTTNGSGTIQALLHWKGIKTLPSYRWLSAQSKWVVNQINVHFLPLQQQRWWAGFVETCTGLVFTFQSDLYQTWLNKHFDILKLESVYINSIVFSRFTVVWFL